jgi:hypothetical protein
MVFVGSSGIAGARARGSRVGSMRASRKSPARLITMRRTSSFLANALLEVCGRIHPLLLLDRDRSGRWQLLNIRSPVDGKPSVADLEGDPLATIWSPAPNVQGTGETSVCGDGVVLVNYAKLAPRPKRTSV